MVRALFATVCLPLLVLAFSACGKPYAPKQFDASTKDFTGATNSKGTPYTGASDSSDLELLKQAIDPTPKPNLDLAASIKAVSITRLDLAGNPVSAAPAKLDLKITFGTKVANYAPVLNASHEAAAVSSSDSDAKLNVRCLDGDCTSVEVKLSQGTSEAGFIYRLRPVTVEILGPFAVGAAPTGKLDRISTLISAEKAPLLVTTEVAWGPAMFELRSGDVGASGDLVATGGDEENISIRVKDEPSIQGRLLGNSNHGDLLLRVTDGAAWAFMRVRLPVAPTGAGAVSPDDGDTSTPAPPDDTPVGDRYIPYDPANPITAFFQRDKTNPVVQDAIRNFASGKRMHDFLTGARPNLPVVLRDLATQQIPPEFLFITYVESGYFNNNYEIAVSSAKAVGPWQFMLDTGRGLGLKTFEPSVVKSRVVNGKQMYRFAANPCDERGDLDKSTIAAAKYLRKLLDTFRHDPKLAVMAYNLGAGGLNRRLNCINEKQNGASACSGSIKPLQEYDAARLDYWEIRRLNAAPKESIDYVPRFLAAQFVGRAPSAYGITVDTSFATPAPALPASCSSK